MEVALSAIASDLINRLTSFLMKKYMESTSIDDKMKRLKELLLRVHIVVEEADGRCITNPMMLMQLKMLAESMYRGYYMLDTIKYKSPKDEEQIINILLQNPCQQGGPLVLPIIGGCRVGKKALVSHVCGDERIRSYFRSILYINGDNMWGMEHTNFKRERTLIVGEFFTDIDEDDWVKFYSTISQKTDRGSKVIIISRIGKLARFGTVKTVCLNSLSQEEYSYLFKMLAFGSIDEKDHPKMAMVANDLAVVLGGSLITANVVADLLRRNHDFQLWNSVLQRFKEMVKSNLSKYGEHPKDIIEKEHPIDITRFGSSYRTRLHLMPPRVERDDSPNRKKPSLLFRDLIAGCAAIPDGDFELVTWESRIPPHTMYVQSVVAFVNVKNGCTTSTRKRRSNA
ncbi:putative disease resistance protein RGA3 isoform X1 [Oryza sativa Japonica Group]|uniref:putative disease resistance protein RGA3 isoform X1 n=1 Tax=Oryza sativa subsp. japonica TaxID=39947 RepID=UPI0001C7AA79|nr:uncharacterized protein LOC4348050 isoform X1 [Oryza sativa Japonica Group]